MQQLQPLFDWPSRNLEMFANYKATPQSRGGGAVSGETIGEAEVNAKALFRSLQKRLETFSMSTSFSGVDTPASAVMMIAVAFPQAGLGSISQPANVSKFMGGGAVQS